MHKFKALEKYWKNNDAVFVNKSEYIKNLLTHYQRYTIAILLLKSKDAKKLDKISTKLQELQKWYLLIALRLQIRIILNNLRETITLNTLLWWNQIRHLIQNSAIHSTLSWIQMNLMSCTVMMNF